MVSYQNSVLSLFFFNVIWKVQLANAVDFTTILTEAVFNQIAPNAVFPYTYSGFVNAVNSWNSNHASNKIFSGSTEMEQRHELAAFFGNTLHESDGFRASREYFMCQNSQVDGNGVRYCLLPSTQFNSASGQYCSTSHTNPASGGYEDGCNCQLQNPDASLGSTYVNANYLFFGRGAIQLSWNYNYIDASKELSGSASTLCNAPELVATSEEYAWGTALWFWTMNTGSVGKTCSTAALTDGDFGGTVRIINGGLECPASSGHANSLAQRLNYYCGAATKLNADALLTLDDCSGMSAAFNACAVAGGTCSDCTAWVATASPSSSPSTKSPTTSPSSSPPTSLPTKAPTVSPTNLPTASPTTSSPSTSPSSKSPSTSPSSSPPTLQPTKAPTVSPTNLPTASPTTSSPSTSPSTKSPSTSPSSSPPTSPPTKAPTVSPTNLPTASPTTTPPSKSPSIPPTHSPSLRPTTAAPTVSPTDLPTRSPNTPQTASPSKLPTTTPSKIPTTLPTHSPSLRPTTPQTAPPTTASPTALQTLKPTNSPVAAPTTGSGSGYYFPNWGAGSAGPNVCLLDDGSHTLPSGAPLFASLQECCDTHYGWNHNECMGVVIGPSGKYFPNWGGSPNVCLLDDGSHTLPGGAPLYSGLEACCATHYSWNSNECNGVVVGPSGKFFPNWGGSPNVCLLDDGSHTLPDGAPLYSGLEACCATHYSWNSNDCNGVVVGPTGKYFPNWGGSPNVCLLDDGSHTLPDGAPLYSGLAACCATHYSWNSNECNGVVVGPTGKYFPNWEGSSHVCLLDDGSNTLPAVAPMYNDRTTCCATHYSWNSKECNGW